MVMNLGDVEPRWVDANGREIPAPARPQRAHSPELAELPAAQLDELADRVADRLAEHLPGVRAA
jgi:hypothetical protein